MLRTKKDRANRFSEVLPHVLNNIKSPYRQAKKFKDTNDEVKDVFRRIPELKAYQVNVTATIKRQRKALGLKL